MGLEFKNWKLKQVKDVVEIIADDSIVYRDFILRELNLPVSNSESVDRSETSINWNLVPNYYKFYFDNENSEKQVENYLRNAELSESEYIIILYGWNEPVIKIPTKIFLSDCEGFIRSTFWETIIFSEKFDLIVEVSRDYFMHSNFIIKTDFSLFQIYQIVNSTALPTTIL